MSSQPHPERLAWVERIVERLQTCTSSHSRELARQDEKINSDRALMELLRDEVQELRQDVKTELSKTRFTLITAALGVAGTCVGTAYFIYTSFPG